MCCKLSKYEKHTFLKLTFFLSLGVSHDDEGLLLVLSSGHMSFLGVTSGLQFSQSIQSFRFEEVLPFN